MGATSTSHRVVVSTPVSVSVLASYDRLWPLPPLSGPRPYVLVLTICNPWLSVAHHNTTTSLASEIVFTSRARHRRSMVIACALLRPMIVRSVLDFSSRQPQDRTSRYLLPFVTFLYCRPPPLRAALAMTYSAPFVLPANRSLNFLLHFGQDIRFMIPSSSSSLP